MLSLASHFTQNKVSTRNPRAQIRIKDHKVSEIFKTSLCNHHSPKPGHITASPICNFVKLHNVCFCYDCTTYLHSQGTPGHSFINLEPFIQSV